jgi:hypothetical protein
MPPPAPKGRGCAGAAAAAVSSGRMRQAGLAEVFSRASQQQGLRSPQGRTGSNLDGYLGLVDAAGASTPSQNTSRSRGTAAGSAARAGRGKKAAAAAELESEEEELVSEEGISSSDAEDEPPAKRARGRHTVTCSPPGFSCWNSQRGRPYRMPVAWAVSCLLYAVRVGCVCSGTVGLGVARGRGIYIFPQPESKLCSLCCRCTSQARSCQQADVLRRPSCRR